MQHDVPPLATPLVIPLADARSPRTRRRRHRLLGLVRVTRDRAVAALPQLIYARPAAWRVATSLAPRRFPRRSPRPVGDGSPAGPTARDLDVVARPIYFPQLGRGVLSLEPTAGPPVDPASFGQLVRRARRAERVVVDPAMLRTPSGQATISRLAAAGACIETAGHGRASGAGHVVRFEAPGHRRGVDRRARELTSVRTRRAAFGDQVLASSAPRRGPSVSVLLASRRPADLPGAVEQVARQRAGELQLVIGAHGDRFPERAVREAVDRWSGDLIVKQFGHEVPFGSVLGELTALAEGELVTKWDDDDWYGPDHVGDLVLAYHYSGADIVGKAAEFVYLEACDATIRRFAVGAESYCWTLAGGTLLCAREWIGHVGGWAPVRQNVDRELLAASLRAGGVGYRTHGFQYVLHRRANGEIGHTWPAPDRYFLDAAVERRPHLDLRFADVDDHADHLSTSRSLGDAWASHERVPQPA